MPITALPPAPSRSQDPANFSDTADTWVASLAQFTTEANALETAVNADEISAANSAASALASKNAAALSEAQANAAAAAAQSAAGLPPSPGFGQVLATAGTAQIITSAVTLTAGIEYDADTSAGAFSVTLPASPNVGYWVWLKDHAGTFETNNLTVLRNGHKIQGLTEDYIMDLNNINNVLIYKGAAYGWAIK